MLSKGNKVTDLISKPGFTFSFELIANISQDEIEKIDVDPVFFSVTWHAKVHKCENLEIDPIRTALFLRSKGKDVLLHLTCDMLKKNYLDQLLLLLQDNGICNLFVILGDNYNANTSEFSSTSELIRYIRVTTGDYFCIGVAGFPEASEEKFLQLKKKLDSGADFIVTQAFFESEILKKFFELCRKFFVSVPILPGVFLFENYNQLISFLNVCKEKASETFLNAVKSKIQVGSPCTDIIKSMVQDLKLNTKIDHFHFFTMNKINGVSTLIKEIN